MLFFLPISSLIGRQQELIHRHPCSRAIIRMLTRLLIYHSNVRCNGMFDSSTIRQIRTSGARHDYLVFLARLFPVIYEICPKIKHHWSKSEARRCNNELQFPLTMSSRFSGQRNKELHKCFWLNNKRSDYPCLYSSRRGLGMDADTRRYTR